MPYLAGDMLRVFVSMNGQDLRVSIGSVRRGRMGRELTKQAPERLMLVVRQVLVAEEHDQVFHQRVVHLLELLVAERAGQIDPGDLGADMRRQPFDLDCLIRHRYSSGPAWQDSMPFHPLASTGM